MNQRPRAKKRPAQPKASQSLFAVELVSDLIYETDDFSLTEGYIGTTSRVPYAWAKPIRYGPLDPRYVDGEGVPVAIEGTAAADGLIKAYLFDAICSGQPDGWIDENENPVGRRFKILPCVSRFQRYPCQWSPDSGLYEIMLDVGGLHFSGTWHHFTETGLEDYNVRVDWTATNVDETTQDWSIPLIVENLVSPSAGMPDCHVLLRAGTDGTLSGVGMPPVLYKQS